MTDAEGGPAESDRFGSLLLPRYRASVRPEWTDRNNHLNNSYYLVCVQSAFLDALRHWRGEGGEARSSTGNYTMQSLVTHLRELRAGAGLLIIPRLVGLDEKRTHVLVELYNEDQGFLGAVIEKTSINVARTQPAAVTPFSQDMRTRLEEVLASHAKIPLPPDVQVGLALNPRSPRQTPPSHQQRAAE